jgi:DUF1365 family protein
VRHRRFAPKPHAFDYSMFMVYLDLNELTHVFDGRWLWSVERPNVASFRRRDHLGHPTWPLSKTIREMVQKETGRVARGRIGLLTHLRYFGYCFNPVSFYYLWNEDETAVETIVADVGNTPWNERHPYVLHEGIDEGSPGKHRYRFDKEFHVSPFQDMDSRYDWRFTDPGSTLSVHMECHREGSSFFDATMTMERRELNGSEMAGALARHPFMTGKVVFGIYWQALRLWMKRMPFYTHPAKRPLAGGAA